MLRDGSTAVLDIGSYSTKIGFGTASSPELIPSLAGTYKYRALPLRAARYDSALHTGSSNNNSNSAGCVVGRVAREQQGLLRLSYPVQHGTIVDWAAMTSLLAQSEQVLYNADGLTGAAAVAASHSISDAAVMDQAHAASSSERVDMTTANITSSNYERGGGSSTGVSTLHGRSSIYALVESPFASRVQRARLASLLFETNYGGTSSENENNNATSDSNSNRNNNNISSSAAVVRGEDGVQGIFCGVAPLLALYSTGSTTGVVLDLGEGVASTAAAINGFALSRVMQREDEGATGQTVTTYLQLLMRQYGTRILPCGATTRSSSNSGSMNSASDLFAVQLGRSGHGSGEVVREIKETCCAVAPQALPVNGIAVDASDGENNNNYYYVNGKHNALASTDQRSKQAALAPTRSNDDDEENDNALAKLDAQLVTMHNHTTSARGARQSHVLPDGSTVDIGPEATQAAEVLLRPSLIGSEARGAVELLLATVSLAEMHVRPALYEHVVLTGGTSLMRGLGVRVLSELLHRTPREHRVRVVAPAERGYAAWLGAAFLSQLSTFMPQMVVSRAEYAEQGEAALQSRLFT